MLAELSIRNLRCFKEHAVPFRQRSIVVGPNNAGKSTIIEAMRLVSQVTSRYPNLNFTPAPTDLPVPRMLRGVKPAIDKTHYGDKGVFHHYDGELAQIHAKFENGSSVEIFLGVDAQVFAVIRDASGHMITSKSQAAYSPIPPIRILPQIGPVSRDEKILAPEYASRVLPHSLFGSLHFRNELRHFREEYGPFCNLAEQTWKGLRVHKLDDGQGTPGEIIGLWVRDGDFVAEVGSVGHGLQMWLQTIWFLSRCKASDCVVLDEPDVYMHADIQRRLIRKLTNKFKQVIVATHSIEIISDVSPEEILVVDRSQPVSFFADKLPVVQALSERLGGMQNLQLTRLWRAKKCLLVEGDDLDILRILHDKLFPNGETALDSLPNTSIGGWGGWNYAVGSSMIVKNAVGESIRVYCVLDSDYHTEDEKMTRMEEAKKKHISLHIWRAKELENYLLNAATISRLICKKCANGPNPAEVTKKIESLCEQQRECVTDQIAGHLQSMNRKLDVSTVNPQARAWVAKAWSEEGGAARMVGGKQLIASLSAWSHSQFKVSMNPFQIAQEMQADEIPEEMVDVLTAIEDGLAIPS